MLQGTLDVFSLDEVLGLLAGANKSGVLNVTGDRGVGSLSLRDGQLVAGSIAGRSSSGTLADVAFELLRYREGSFSFDNHSIDDGEPHELATVMVEARARLQEWKAIEAVVPSLDHHLRLADRLATSQVTLNEKEWATIVAIGEGATVGQVADRLGLDEFGGSKRVKGLVERSLATIDAAMTSAPAPVVAEAPAPVEPAPVVAEAPAPVDATPSTDDAPVDAASSNGSAWSNPDPALREAMESARTSPDPDTVIDEPAIDEPASDDTLFDEAVEPEVPTIDALDIEEMPAPPEVDLPPIPDPPAPSVRDELPPPPPPIPDPPAPSVRDELPPPPPPIPDPPAGADNFEDIFEPEPVEGADLHTLADELATPPAPPAEAPSFAAENSFGGLDPRSSVSDDLFEAPARSEGGFRVPDADAGAPDLAAGDDADGDDADDDGSSLLMKYLNNNG